jgi:hypothetical protein
MRIYWTLRYGEAYHCTGQGFNIYLTLWKVGEGICKTKRNIEDYESVDLVPISSTVSRATLMFYKTY